MTEHDDGLGFVRGAINACALMLGFVCVGLAVAGHFLPLGFGLAAAFGFYLGMMNAQPRKPRVVYLDGNQVARLHARAQRKRVRAGGREVGSASDVPTHSPDAA